MVTAYSFQGNPKISETSRINNKKSLAPAEDATQESVLAWQVKVYLIAIITPVSVFVGPMLVTSVRLVFLVLAFTMILQIARGKLGRLNFVDIALLLYVFWVAVSMAVVTPNSLVQAVGSTGLDLLGGYFLARLYIQTREQFVSMCKWLVTLCVVLTPLAILESTQGRVPVLELLNNRIPGIVTETIKYTDERLGLRRAQVVFVHPIHYGVFCSICFALVLVSLKGWVGRTPRLVASAFVGLGVFLSLSSGAILAVLLQIALVFWSFIVRHKTKWLLLIGIFLVGLVLVWLVSGDSPIRVFMRYATFSAHNAFWRSIIFEYGMMNVMQSPWVGLAGGASEWVRPDFMPSASIDNYWLMVAVVSGLPALVLVAVAYFGAMIRIALRDFQGDDELNQLRLGWMFCFVGLAFTLATVAIWKSVFSLIFFMLGAGIWLFYARAGSKQDEDSLQGANVQPPQHRYTRFPSVYAKPGEG